MVCFLLLDFFLQMRLLRVNKYSLLYKITLAHVEGAGDVHPPPPRPNSLILKQFSGKLGQIMGWHSIPIRHTTRHLGNPEPATELEQPRSDLFCLSFLHSTYVRLFNNLLMPGNSLDEQIYFLVQNEKLNRLQYFVS